MLRQPGRTHTWNNMEREHQHEKLYETQNPSPLIYHDIAFPAPYHHEPDTNITIRGWWIPYDTQPSPCIILIHGAGMDRREWLPVIPWLHSQNVSILVYDTRGWGTSDRADEGLTYGYGGQWDVDGAMSYLHTHHTTTCSHTLIMGMSGGGATALMSFPRNQNDIDGMIVMASFIAVSDVLKHVTPMFFKKFRDIAAAKTGLEVDHVIWIVMEQVLLPEWLSCLAIHSAVWRMNGSTIALPLSMSMSSIIGTISSILSSSHPLITTIHSLFTPHDTPLTSLNHITHRIPLLLVHAKNDHLVPYAHGVALMNMAKQVYQQDEHMVHLITLGDAGHNLLRVTLHPDVKKGIIQLLESIQFTHQT